VSYESVILDEMNYGGLPFAYWPLDEPDGTAAVDLMARARGTDNSGSYVAEPTLDQRPGPLAKDRTGWPLFNGSSQYGNVGTLGNLGSALGNGLTIEAWLRTSSSAIQSVLGVLEVGNAIVIGLTINRDEDGDNVAGKVQAFLRGRSSKMLIGATSSATAVHDGSTHHIVAALNSATNAVAIYLDSATLAVSYRSQDTPASFGDLTGAAYVGARNLRGVADFFFSGNLGRVAVYNYILAAGRVAAHYLAGKHGTCDWRTE